MCYNLEKIKHILKSVMTDIDFVEGKLKNLVYQDQSQFRAANFLSTLLVYGVENYDNFSNYTFEISSWFMEIIHLAMKWAECCISWNYYN